MDPSDRQALFKHYPVVPEMIQAFTERMGPECHTLRVENGQRLAWKFGKFTLGKGKNSKRETRAYAVYVNSSGQPVDHNNTLLAIDFKKLPALKIVGPPAPTRGVWIKMRGALKPPPNTSRPIEKSSQSIDLDDKCTDTELYPQWVQFCKDMIKFTRDDRCRALVEHVLEHDYFDDEFRDFAENDPDEAIDQLIRAHDSINDSSQNPCRFWNANRVIFKPRKEEGNMMKISPRDADILKVEGFDPLHEDGPFEGQPKIANFLQTSPTYWELNLMKISLPKRGEYVRPEEYGLINRGGVASVEIHVYGMYERIDGKKRQIGISIANTGCAILNNGPKEAVETTKPDVMDILMGRHQNSEEAKRQKLDSDED